MSSGVHLGSLSESGLVKTCTSWEFPGGPVVQSPVGELRSHKLRGVAKKKKKSAHLQFLYLKAEEEEPEGEGRARKPGEQRFKEGKGRKCF